MGRLIHQADRREENTQSAVSCIERGSKRNGENQKERLQYLATGTEGTATEQGAGYIYVWLTIPKHSNKFMPRQNTNSQHKQSDKSQKW